MTSTSPGTLTGTVQFLDGVTIIGTGTLDIGQQATLVTSTLTPGSHSITAAYLGDGTFLASTSAVLTQTVNATGLATSTAVIFGEPVNRGTGRHLHGNSDRHGNANCTVQFLDGATLIGTGTVSTGHATFSTSALVAGSHSITAKYPGDATFAGSTSAALTQTVNGKATSTAVTFSANPSTAGQAVTFTATVTGTGTPTGNVQFLDGATLIVWFREHRSCYILHAALVVGSHSITAKYLGDATFAVSTSAALTQTVNATGQATSTAVSSSANPSTTGQSVTFTATVTATERQLVPSNFLTAQMSSAPPR